MEYLQLVITGLSVIAAILAWLAKLRWSKEFAAAKDETIRAKEAVIGVKDAQILLLEREIENLRELTPMRLREYTLSIKEQLEEYNDRLLKQVDELKEEIAQKSTEISKLSLAGVQKEEELRQAKIDKEMLNRKAEELRTEIEELKTVSAQVTSASDSLDKLATHQYLQGVFIVGKKERLRLKAQPGTLGDYYRNKDKPAPQRSSDLEEDATE